MLFEQASKSTLPDKPSEETMEKGLEHFLPGLNDEALALQILSYLTLGDLLKLSRVNTTWQRLTQDQQLWRQIWLNLKDHLTQGFIWQYFLQPAPAAAPGWMAYIQAVMRSVSIPQEKEKQASIPDDRLQQHNALLRDNQQAQEIQSYLNELATKLLNQAQSSSDTGIEQHITFSADNKADYYTQVKYFLIAKQFEENYFPWLVFLKNDALFKPLGIASYPQFLDWLKANYPKLWVEDVQPLSPANQRSLVDMVHYYTSSVIFRLLTARLQYIVQQATATNSQSFEQAIKLIDQHLQKAPTAAVSSCISAIFSDNTPDAQVIVQAICTNQPTVVSHVTIEHVLHLAKQPSMAEMILANPRLVGLLKQQEKLADVAIHLSTLNLPTSLRHCDAFIENLDADSLVAWVEQAKYPNGHFFASYILMHPILLDRIIKATLDQKAAVPHDNFNNEILPLIKIASFVNTRVPVILGSKAFKSQLNQNPKVWNLLVELLVAESNPFALSIAQVPEIADRLTGKEIVAIFNNHPAAEELLRNENVINALSYDQAIELAFQSYSDALLIVERKNFELKHLDQLWEHFKYCLEEKYTTEENARLLSLIQSKRQALQAKSAPQVISPPNKDEISNQPNLPSVKDTTVNNTESPFGKDNPPIRAVKPVYRPIPPNKKVVRKTSVWDDFTWQRALVFLGLTTLILLGIALCLTGKGAFAGVPIISKVLSSITSIVPLTTTELSMSAVVTGALLEAITIPIMVATFFQKPIKRLFNALLDLFVSNEREKPSNKSQGNTKPVQVKVMQPLATQPAMSPPAFNPYQYQYFYPANGTSYPVPYAIAAQPIYFIPYSPVTGYSDYRPANGFMPYIQTVPITPVMPDNPIHSSIPARVPTLGNNS